MKNHLKEQDIALLTQFINSENIAPYHNNALQSILVQKSNTLSNEDINLLADTCRDIALAIEWQDVDRAYQLISLALSFRPSGPVLQKKHAEYQKLLNIAAAGETQKINSLELHSIENITKRIRYSSFILKEYKLAYIETPKCACSTMKNIMCYLDGLEPPKVHVGKESSLAMAIHNRGVNPVKNINNIDDLSTHLKSDWIRFCIVRNPYARLASAWADKIRQREPGHKETWEKINKFNRKKTPELSSCPSFKDFVNWVVNALDSENCNIHWRAMNKLLYPELINYTHTLKTESLANDFQEVLNAAGIKDYAAELLNKFRTNESLPIDWKSLYDEELAVIVYEHFVEDFTLYKYDKDSWKLNKPQQSTEEELRELREKKLKLYNTALEAIRNRNDVIEHLVEKGIPSESHQKKKALVIGDSHAKIFENILIKSQTPHIDWDVISVPGATLSGLSNPNSKTQAMPIFNWALENKTYNSVIFQLGEVDLGFVIHYRAKFNKVMVEDAFETALENYKELINSAKKKAPAIVMSTCLPTISDDSTGEVQNARKSVDTSQYQRTELTLKFNAKLKDWCKENNVTFINLDTFTLGKNGLIKNIYLNNNKRDHHYNPNSFSKLINKELLPKLRTVIHKK